VFVKLYLGLDAPCEDGVVHYPVIRIEPLEISQEKWDRFPLFTHILFTSKTTVKLLAGRQLSGKTVLAIGQKTARLLPGALVAKNETQEGMVELLSSLNLQKSFVLYPRSNLARDLLKKYLEEQEICHEVWDLYTTVFQKPLPEPDFSLIDEIVFTSPSTVRAFIAAFGQIPKGKKLSCIGPVTRAELDHILH
jgi:uroporphyrinogen-III synthase